MSIDGAKKHGRGRPRVDSEPVNVRVDRAMIEAIDRWRALEDPEMTRPEAMRRLVEYALAVAETSGKK
ncbi:hypothetical protein [Blastomonas sp. UPD001]|uniref:hypothetical protein n=1 Tax=Blastomonas sp. UPD001 TaxID=2217673 RepID=UPI00130095DE|nr:hypothetical protein [Blastomonas sp. UPD001]